MRILSRQNIELISEKVMDRYFNDERIKKIEKTNIKPSLLAMILGLKIEYHSITQDKSILGITSFHELEIQVFDNEMEQQYCSLDGKTIIIDKFLIEEYKYKGKLNFTLAHEISHQIYKMMYPKDYGFYDKVYCSKVKSEKTRVITDWEEWQADTLAAAILLPKAIIYPALNKFEFNNGIELLDKYAQPRVYLKFCRLAEYLGVSKSTLAIRLEQLGILKENNLFNKCNIDITRSD